MKVVKVGEESFIQRMIKLVQSADAGKAKIVRLADRWATWIVVIALTAAEKMSEHLLSKAAVKCYQKKTMTVQDFKMIPGEGVIATVEGRQVREGNLKLFSKNIHVKLSYNLAKGTGKYINQGSTVIYIAVDAADIVLVEDEIKELPHLFALSKRMMRTIKFNLTFSMELNFLAIILAIKGTLGPVIDALVHNAGLVFVIINSALLLKRKTKIQKK